MPISRPGGGADYTRGGGLRGGNMRVWGWTEERLEETTWVRVEVGFWGGAGERGRNAGTLQTASFKSEVEERCRRRVLRVEERRV
ncbi:hypothetical protein CVT26_007398 [Gymnopilus dilepis]|uniref:Uncharacterized protein n=1 Tax=Gymnopilus dilepis TaxID=231916 RepID=A0A409WTA7_9AGAR|nr:hypothetical protein CVT26_007398 [Gymnopilus dilepis]